LAAATASFLFCSVNKKKNIYIYIYIYYQSRWLPSAQWHHVTFQMYTNSAHWYATTRWGCDRATTIAGLQFGGVRRKSLGQANQDKAVNMLKGKLLSPFMLLGAPPSLMLPWSRLLGQDWVGVPPRAWLPWQLNFIQYLQYFQNNYCSFFLPQKTYQFTYIKQKVPANTEMYR
jgi:hypothetical protein